jgi:hypothetical protein
MAGLWWSSRQYEVSPAAVDIGEQAQEEIANIQSVISGLKFL